MYRSLFGLIFAFFSAYSFAGSCVVNSVGYYESFSDMVAACDGGHPNGSCGGSFASGTSVYRGWGTIYSNGNFFSYVDAGQNMCSGSSEYDITYYVYYAPASGSSCPGDSIPIPEFGNACGCEGHASLDLNSGMCVELPVDDDFSDENLPFDDSENSGGSDNDHGGDPGSECNFAPEGCAPGDKPDRPAIGDIDAPDTSAPPPPDAVTTGEKTETNSDGTTTTTSTREWTETDGSTVKETIREITNPDGSKTTEKVLERNSPNGSTATTTVKSETDSQGNVTISGTTQEKQTEKEGSVSGGNTCDSAPSCNGDAIQCAILQQQWLTRCDKNTEYSDSDCTAQPQCQGDVLLCAGLINEWQNRCALQKSPSDAETFFKDRGFKTAEDYAAEGGIFGGGESTDVSTIADGVFSSRSSVSGTCPANIAFTAGNFGNFELSLEPFCMLAEEIYWLVLLSAYMTAAFIIFRSITN